MAVLKSALVATLDDRVSGPARRMSHMLGRLQRSGAGFGAAQRRMQAPVLGMTRNLLALGGAYLGLREGMSGTLGGAMRLETAMADVAKKTSLTNHQLDQTRKKILGLSNMKGGRSATEIAQLYAQAGQFGIANAELDRFVKLGSKASIAFDMTAANTADSLSQLKNALGLTMPGLESLADAINFTADTAGTSEKQLIDFLLRTSAAAKTYGITGEEMAAFGATLNEIGIDSAKAGTGMNAMIAKLAGLSRNKKAVKVLDAVGGKGYSAALQKKFYDRPVDAMREFFSVVQKMDVQQRSGLLIDFFGLEYQDDAAAIANNIDKIVGRLETLKDTSRFAGSVDKAFEIFANTSEEKLKRLQRIFANGGAMLGAKLLPPIVDAAEKISDTLSTLGQRVTVFDTHEARAKGFLTGLGLDMSGGLAEGMTKLWDGLFGRTDQLAADTERMGAAFERSRKMGADLRAFAGDVAATIGEIEAFLGLDHGAVGGVLADMAGYGALLGAGAVGLSLFAGPLRLLAKGALLLSGIKPAWGLLRFLGKLAKLGGSAAGIAALAKATGALGKSAKALPAKNPQGFGTVTKGSGSNGRISQDRLKKMGQGLNGKPQASAPSGPRFAGWGGVFSVLSAIEMINAIPKDKDGVLAFMNDNRRQASGVDAWLESHIGSPKAWRDKLLGPRLGPVQGPPVRPYEDRAKAEAEAAGGVDGGARFNPMKGFNVLGDFERRIGAGAGREVSLVGTPSVTLAADSAVTVRPSGVQEVRVTNPNPPQITVQATITVNEAQNAAQIANALGDAVKAELSGLQADTSWSGA